ncbi:MAG TPA: prenyltransferase/squalene oxidase repeat-containing protein [Solirubrobacter sp.]|nr:prenyltransferase/squalene oxidase repeat-containing protein [Solirubrobacter sp.]
MVRSLPIAALAALAIAAPSQANTVDYVRGAQNADGGFGMTQSGGSSQLATGWALLGLNAAGRRPGPAALAYIRRGLGGLREIGDVERTVLVLRAARQNPRRFGGRNLISDILRHRRRDGSFDGYVSYTSFAIFALRRSGVSRSSGTIRSAARWLERHQNADGGFNVGGRGTSGVDDTGYAAQALAAAGRRGKALRRAASYLARAQTSNGGWGFTRGAAPNAQSTAYAIQGLVAARGYDRAIRRGQSYLRSLTEPNGLVRYSRTSRQTPVWVSAQALMALNRRTF